MKWKFDWLKAKAPEAADAALAVSEAKSEGDVAAQAALLDLAKKEAEVGAVAETAEATAEAEKDAPVEEELEIDPEGLAELLTEIVENVETLKARETKEVTVDMAPIEKGFSDVNAAFEQVRKERDEQAVQIKELNAKIDIVAGALERLIGLQPKATQKEFKVEYRATESPETVIQKENVKDLVAVQPADTFDAFAKWAGIPTQ